jgi:hypothetical protein
MLTLLGYWSVLDREQYVASYRRLLEEGGDRLDEATREALERAIDTPDPFIHPEALVAPDWEPERRPRIVSYLRSGVFAGGERGDSYCRFSCGARPEELGAGEFSDGVWVWPQGLAHYVEAHLIRLPEEFIAHLEAVDFKTPRWLTGASLLGQPHDTSFWIRWCAENRRL